MRTHGWGWGLVVAAVLIGCGDDGGGTGGGGTGGGGTGGGGTGGSGPVECGGTDVELTVTVTDVLTTQVLSDVEVTADICPGVVATTDDLGVVKLALPANTPVNGRIDLPGYLPARAGEFALAADHEQSGFIFPDSLADLVPGLGPSNPSLLILLNVPEGTPESDPCGSAAGATFEVVGFPDATVTYYSDAGPLPEPDATLTETTANGVASVQGLTAQAEPVEVRGTKEGCATLSFVSYPFTGRVLLENGILSAVAGSTIATSAP
jgi:hypothetical protein